MALILPTGSPRRTPSSTCYRALAAIVVLSACGGTAQSGTGSGKQFDDQVAVSASAETWLFVLDDRTDTVADELRQLYAGQFVAVWADPSRYCAVDPVAWHPIHRQVVVAYASAQPGGRSLSSADVPGLGLDTPVVTRANLAQWGDAVRTALTAPPAPSAATPGLLQILTDGATLLAGTRQPQIPAEQRLVQAAGSSSALVAFLVSATDDQSSGDPASYAVHLGQPLGNFGVFSLGDAVVPPADPGCAGQACPAASRFETWRSASDGVTLTTWRSGDAGELVGRLSAGQCDPKCVPVPAIQSNGQVACRLFVTPRDPGVCPSEEGWFAPDPPVAGDGSLCEVRQLDGAALQSCETDLACAGCTAGFCVTHVTELSDTCTQRENAAFPRVIAGTGSNEPRSFRVVCDEPM